MWSPRSMVRLSEDLQEPIVVLCGRWVLSVMRTPGAGTDSLQVPVVTGSGACLVYSVLVWRCCGALGPTAEHVGGPLNALH